MSTYTSDDVSMHLSADETELWERGDEEAERFTRGVLANAREIARSRAHDVTIYAAAEEGGHVLRVVEYSHLAGTGL